MKLAAARIFVRDIEQATAFYEATLGLKVTVRAPEAGYVVLDGHGCDLVIERVPPDAASDEQALVGRFTGLSFAVKDIAVLHRTLAQRGVTFTAPPERQGWGGVLATLRDPADNELQLVQYPVDG